MIWKYFLYYWPFVCGIHRWPVDSSPKGPVMGSFDVFFNLTLNNLLKKQMSLLLSFRPWCSCDVTNILWFQNWMTRWMTVTDCTPSSTILHANWAPRKAMKVYDICRTRRFSCHFLILLFCHRWTNESRTRALFQYKDPPPGMGISIKRVCHIFLMGIPVPVYCDRN